MDGVFFHELQATMRNAYDNNKPTDVPNFSHWWVRNHADIAREMRIRAAEGICYSLYPLPSDWAFYLDDCRSFFLSKFSDDFDVYVNLITRGIYNEVTLEVRW
jgi:hypothetical protein